MFIADCNACEHLYFDFFVSEAEKSKIKFKYNSKKPDFLPTCFGVTEVPVGGDCTNASQCLNKDAECAQDKCKCPDKTYADDKNCLAGKTLE